MNIEKEREAFIEHFKSTDCYKELVEYCLGLEDDEDAIFELNNKGKFKFGGDGFGVVQVAFDSWQASALREAKLEGCVVVPESELTNTFYWPDSEYVVDCPFDYDFELDKGEIQVIEKWQRTKSTKIYFANIYKDEESFEIKEFPSLEAAQEAVKENDAYLEAKADAEG